MDKSNIVDVKIMSHLNFDSFDIDGVSYKLDQLDELREAIAGREINWVRGVNVFNDRKPVGDKFMKSMIDCYETACTQKDFVESEIVPKKSDKDLPKKEKSVSRADELALAMNVAFQETLEGPGAP